MRYLEWHKAVSTEGRVCSPVYNTYLRRVLITYLLTMTAASPRISSNSFLIRLPLHLSLQPLHITLTQLHPSTTILLHVTTSRSQPRLSDAFVVSMQRGTEVISSRLEGLRGLGDDIDLLARLLCINRIFVFADL